MPIIPTLGYIASQDPVKEGRKGRRKEGRKGGRGRERERERENASWAQVAHTCNASYSGGRDQEDHGSKPAQANSL
jgi:hypothetical protein